MKQSIAEARMKMLLALKRDEKPPENFLREFLAEFQRRNYGTNNPVQPSSPKTPVTPAG